MIKSQDELPQSGRDNSTLIEVISKLENTTKELERVKKQLEIAVNALDLYKNFNYDGTLKNYESIAKNALNKIRELEK